MLERNGKEQTTGVTKLLLTKELTFVRSELLRKEVLTKQEACWLANISRATWDRYAAEKAKGNPLFEDFPETLKPSGKKSGRCKYKTCEVAYWVNTWLSW